MGVCITDKAASDEVKAAFENSATVLLVLLVFSSRMTRRTGVKSEIAERSPRPQQQTVSGNGAGQEKRRDDGIPGITNYIFSERPLVECTNAGPIS